eukprot:TRINITY_DN25184_c1_g1_i1.p1 TRINITY_DN25184_c1_g1~~TRINITY_DN25184_c1_g1_i1.p1  ORF type:complete len:183 (-),score=11.62 TRINITY_DN25184_c1_g1_i1:151-630(-)
MQTSQDMDMCGVVRIGAQNTTCKPAQCRLYSVDMAFAGGEGLVTDTNSALIILICSHLTQVNKECLSVQGPQDGAVRSFSQVENSTKVFQIVVEWEEDYLGQVVVDLQKSRTNAALMEKCSLAVLEPSCNETNVGVVYPLSFQRKDKVNLKAVSYQILV